MMTHSAFLAFVLAWSMQGAPLCEPNPTITLRPVQDFRSPSGKTSYQVYTAWADRGSTRTIYQVRTASTSTLVSYTKDGKRDYAAPEVFPFIENDRNGTLVTRIVPSSCALPVLEGFDS